MPNIKEIIRTSTFVLTIIASTIAVIQYLFFPNSKDLFHFISTGILTIFTIIIQTIIVIIKAVYSLNVYWSLNNESSAYIFYIIMMIAPFIVASSIDSGYISTLRYPFTKIDDPDDTSDEMLLKEASNIYIRTLFYFSFLIILWIWIFSSKNEYNLPVFILGYIFSALIGTILSTYLVSTIYYILSYLYKLYTRK